MAALGLEGAFHFEEGGRVASEAYHSSASDGFLAPAVEGFGEISGKFC